MTTQIANGKVVSVSISPAHTFSKPVQEKIQIVEGLGVEGDAHAGPTVKHRSRVRQDPNQPNLRQVHLIASEVLDELRTKGFDVQPGQLGENILTSGIDLAALPEGTLLRIGSAAVVRVTGLRNPCSQIDGLMPGLMDATLDRDADGNLVRKAGIMSVAVASGEVMAGQEIVAEAPDDPQVPLDVV